MERPTRHARPNRREEWLDTDGVLHRTDGSTALLDENGNQGWYLHGGLHREDGPAKVYIDGMQVWYQHDRRHRDDGPALICPDGRQQWWRHGRQVEGPSERMLDERQGFDAVAAATSNPKRAAAGADGLPSSPAGARRTATPRTRARGQGARGDARALQMQPTSRPSRPTPLIRPPKTFRVGVVA